jgi:hypothetical protein
MERAVLSPGLRLRRKLLGAAVLPLLVLNGCASMSNTDKGALIGGAAGAGVGAAIGNACHNTAAGAVIGGAAGLVTGAIIGNNKDQKEAAQAHAAARQMTMDDVIRMTHDHISDEIIIGRVRDSGMVFHLTAAEIETLKANGVSDPIIMEMQATATRPQRVVYTAVPVYSDPVYVAPPPPPGPTIGVGFGYTRYH